MKYKYLFFSLFFSCSIITSCSNFLDEDPQSEIGSENYFTKPDHARAAVNTLYREGVAEFYINALPYDGSGYMYGGYISGLFDNDYKGQVVFVQHCQALTFTPDNISEKMDYIWNNCYKAISHANTVIKNINKVVGLEEEERARLLAEAKFFRAFNYFYLVKAFGDLPLILEPYESLDNLYVSRTSISEVYSKIVSDLKECLNGGLNDTYFSNNGFRVTKGAAEMLLSSVYLQMSGYPLQENHYKEAADMARSIIKAGKHALTPNGTTPEESAYNKIRTIDNSNEYIYSVEFVSGISSTKRPQYSFYPSASWGIFKYSVINNAYRPGEIVINFYDKEMDLRAQEKQYFFNEYTYLKNNEYITQQLDETCCWFFYDEKALLETGDSEKDIAIFRYAETLLIAAEAIAQSEGVTDEAINYLAQVRGRAYQQNAEDIAVDLKGLSKENFIAEVWKERLRELIPECRIWDDIQRTRMYPKASAKNPGQIEFINIIGAKNPWGATFEEKHLLWPISKNEIQRNPSLVQNPGY